MLHIDLSLPYGQMHFSFRLPINFETLKPLKLYTSKTVTKECILTINYTAYVGGIRIIVHTLIIDYISIVTNNTIFK